MSIQKEIISGLPIFLGLTKRELESISQSVSFTMRHYKKGAVMAAADDVANDIIFITSGWFEAESVADSRAYRIVELLQSSHTVEPDKLFGLNRHYRATYRALTPCEVITISKDSLLELLGNYLIVRLNFLNIICRKSQHLEHNPWRACSQTLKGRITDFIKCHSLYPAGNKRLYIKMTQLAAEVNDSRLDVSLALNEMAREEHIILKRGIIEIPAMQLL